MFGSLLCHRISSGFRLGLGPILPSSGVVLVLMVPGLLPRPVVPFRAPSCLVSFVTVCPTLGVGATDGKVLFVKRLSLNVLEYWSALCEPILEAVVVGLFMLAAA